MKEGTNLEELVEQFTARTVSVRLSAYRTLTQKLTGGDAVAKYNWSNFMSEEDSKNAVLNIKADLFSDSEDISYEAAGACGCLLASGSFVSMLQVTTQKEIVEDLIKVMKEKKGKKIVVRTLWCISRSKFGSEVYREKAEVLLEAICDILKNETSSAAAFEALQVIHTLLDTIPEIVTKDVKIWFPVSFRYILHEAERIRNIVYIILYSIKMFLDESEDKGELRSYVVSCLASETNSKTCKRMIELVSKDCSDVLKEWRLIVQLLGVMLHKGTSLINDLLEVVEKGFKSSHPVVRVEAFRCWKALIDNFALDIDVLTHHKRLKLLLAPLRANNAKSESIAHEKLLVWWHLVVKLKNHAATQFDTVVVPLFKFCFSGTSPSSPGGQNIGLAQRNLMMSVAASPGRKFPGLFLLCGEVMAQLLSTGMDIPERQPFVFSITPLEEPLINDAIFARALQLIFACVGEVFNSFNDENNDVKRRDRQSALVTLIIQSLITRILKAVKNEGNKKDSVEQVKEIFTLFSEIEHTSKPGDPLSNYVFKFYEIITTSQELALPLSVINSRQYNISTGNTMQDMMSGTLSNHIIQQLCRPPLLHLATKREEFFTVWITVLDNSKPSTGKLGFLQYVSKEIDGAENFFGCNHPDTLRRMWAITVRQLLSHIEQTQIIDQGDGMEHDWTCIYNILLFPINQSVSGFKDTNEEFNQKVMEDWSELWSKFIELTPLAATSDPNSEVEHIARGMLNVYKRVIAVSSENYGITYNLMANILLLLTQKIRYSELGKPSLRQVNSPAKPKKKSPPLCNLTGCVELFGLLFIGLMRMGACPGRISTAQLLCESIMNIFKGVHQEKLLNPLIAEVLPPITEGFKVSPFIMFNADVGKQFVKVMRSFSLMFEERIGSAHTADHIYKLEPLLKLTLTSSTKEIKQAGRQLWKSSFSNTNHNIPSALYEVLKECSLPPASLNDSQEEYEEFNAKPKENVPDNVMAGSFLKRASGLEVALKYESPKSKFDSPKSKFDSPKVGRLSLGTPKTKEKRISLQEMNEEDFVKVVSPKPSRRVLTEHQIEKMKERKDIPAMYSDLSQSASQIILPTQFASQHSFEESVLSEATNSKNIMENDKSPSKQFTFSGLLHTNKKDDQLITSDSPSKTGRNSTPVRTYPGKGRAKNKASPGSEKLMEWKMEVVNDKLGDSSEKKVGVENISKKLNAKDDAIGESGLEKDNESSPVACDPTNSKVSGKITRGKKKQPRETDSNRSKASKIIGNVDSSQSESAPEVKRAEEGNNVKLSEMKENIESPAAVSVLEGGTRLRSTRKNGFDSQDEIKARGTPKTQVSAKNKKSTPKPVVTGVRTRRSRGGVQQLEKIEKDTSKKEQLGSRLSVDEKSLVEGNENKECSLKMTTKGEGSEIESKKSGIDDKSEKLIDSKAANEAVDESNSNVKKPSQSQKKGKKEKNEITDEEANEAVDESNSNVKKPSQSHKKGKKEKNEVTDEEANEAVDESNSNEKKPSQSQKKGKKEKNEITDEETDNKIPRETAKHCPGKTNEKEGSGRRYSNCDSDYTDEDLDEELRKTSIVFQKSLGDSPVEDAQESQFLVECNRRKSQTPSKKSVEDVRKILKGRKSLNKSPSEPSSLKGKAEVVKSQKSGIVESHLELGVTSSKSELKQATVNPADSKDGHVSDSDSEDLVPSSQDDDEPLSEMANKIAMSRFRKSENSKDGNENVREMEEVSRKAKRKRSLDDEIEEDFKQKEKKKRTAEMEESSNNDSLCKVEASDEDDDTEKGKKTESGKPSRIGRKNSNSNTPSSQSSCDLFESNSSVTTPPKVTRSGRKIVAPKKDMPEPMTPPGSHSGKKRKSTDSTLESPKCKVSPSLLNNMPLGSSSVEQVSESESLSQVEMTSVRSDISEVLDSGAQAKKNVQKKITDMFSKENKEPIEGKSSLPEMDKLEDDLLENVSASSVSISIKNYESGYVSGVETSDKCSSKENNSNLDKVQIEENSSSTDMELSNKASHISQENGEKVKDTGDDKIPCSNSSSPMKITLSPPKKRISLNSSLELLSNHDKMSSEKPLEVVTVPESMDVEEISYSLPSTTTKPEKVLSPKKKWAQTAKETELSVLGSESNEVPSNDALKEDNTVNVKRNLETQPVKVIKESALHQTTNNLDMSTNELHPSRVESISSPLRTAEKNVQDFEEDYDDDSDMDVDIEVIDSDLPEKVTVTTSKSKDAVVDATPCVTEGVIDISSSLSSSVSPESRDTSDKTLPAVPESSEKVEVIEAEPDNVIVLSSESKDSSDEIPKSSSKSTDSSSLENAQRVDEELKEIEHKRSPKKDKIFRVNAEEKQFEEESSPEKIPESKFTNTLGTPERQKKFGSVKYAGSRAAMLVACAKQNIKNRSSEGESPSKYTVGDAMKNRLGHSPNHRNGARSVSPAGTPPTSGSKRKSHENENGKPWAKHEPSPGATPSPSILKKSGVDETVGRETTSPPSKQRRVSFADPPVSDRVEIPPSPKTLRSMKAQKRLDMAKAESPIKVSATPPAEQDESQPEPDSPINVNCSQPLYLPLIDCKDSVDRVALELTSPFLFEGLKMVLEERDIRTVGQFCQLTEADIKQLPIREPKVSSTLKVLQKYKETRLKSKKGTDTLIENVEAQLSEIFGEDGEVKLDDRPHSREANGTEVLGTLLHSGLENEDLPMEDGITPLESTVEDVSCETINAFCKQLSENPQLLDVLVENINESSRQKLLQKILVELPYGAVLDTYFEYLRKRDSSSSGR